MEGRGLCFALGLYVDEVAAFFALSEHYSAVNESVEGVVLTHAYVEARVVNCTTLTFDNVACLGELTTKNLHTESFAF